MKTAQDYRRYADECRELARRAKSGEERDAILAIADSWERLAGERERKIGKDRPEVKRRPS
jgi:hypothetical protein